MFKAAQITAQNTVIGISYLTRQFNHPALVWLPMDSPNVIGCQYDAGAGTFTDPDAGTIVYTLGAES